MTCQITYLHTRPLATLLIKVAVTSYAEQSTLGVKTWEANQKQHCKQIATYAWQPKTLISAEAKKLATLLNDIP